MANDRPRTFPGRTATRQAPASAPIAGEVLEQDQAITSLSGGGIAEAMERGAIDIQIRTAKAYPRDITTFLKKVETLSTRDVDTAESCFYTLKRKDRDEPTGFKKIQGPSIRFAEILVACWGHMRVAGVTVAEDDRFVTLRGMSWDLETNSAFSVDVKRRITTRQGHTYSDDMIGVTSNAGISIATRNSILHVIPGAFWKPVYNRCLVVARGDAKTLADRRTRVLAFFEQQYRKTAGEVYAYLGIKGEADFTIDHLEDMQGLRTALRDGETTIEEAFGDVKAGDVPKTPLETIAAELACSSAEATAVLAGFEALTLPPAQRVVQLKKFTGKGAGELLQLLRDMSGHALEVPATPASGTTNPEPQSSITNPQSQETTPNSQGSPTSKAAGSRFKF